MHSGVRQLRAHRYLRDANVLKGSVRLDIVSACFHIFLLLRAPAASPKLQLSRAFLLQELVLDCHPDKAALLSLAFRTSVYTFLSCCWLTSAATETSSECTQESGKGLGSHRNRIPKKVFYMRSDVGKMFNSLLCCLLHHFCCLFWVAV